MEQRRLGSTGVRVSELCLGTMTFGNEADEATSKAIVDRFLDAGGNFVDTANVYSPGVSEEITGRALGSRARRRRARHQGALPDGRRPERRRASRGATSASRSRRRCAGSAPSGSTCTRCTAGTRARRSRRRSRRSTTSCTKARSATSVRATSPGWHLAKALGIAALHDWEPFVSLQPEYSLITRDIERELLPLCREEGLAVLPWSPLGGGVLTRQVPQGRGLPGRAPAAPTPRTRSRSRTGSTTGPGTSSTRSARSRPSSARRRRRSRSTGSRTARASPRRSSAPATSTQLDDNLGAVGWQLEKPQRDALGVGERVPARLPVRVHPVRRALGARDVARVTGIWRYPVKSMQGEPLDRADVGPAGIVGDRQWALVDLDTGLALTASAPARAALRVRRARRRRRRGHHPARRHDHRRRRRALGLARARRSR